MMKNVFCQFLVSGFILPLVCHAEPGPQRTGPRHGEGGGGRAMDFKEAWKKADVDGDGAISKEEFAKMPRVQKLPAVKRSMLFQRLDKDDDGELSREELGRFGNSGEREWPESKRLWELDTDRSGGVSLDEFKLGELARKLPEEKQVMVFNRLDTDGDGALTPKDRGKGKSPGEVPERGRMTEGPHGKPEGVHPKLDTNGDGGISFEEFRVGPAVRNLTEDEQEDRFEMLDRNGDLKISPEDFPNAIKKDKNGGE